MRAQSSRQLDASNTYLYVPNSFQVKPGARINSELFVGKGLGVGLQVAGSALQVTSMLVLPCVRSGKLCSMLL